MGILFRENKQLHRRLLLTRICNTCNRSYLHCKLLLLYNTMYYSTDVNLAVKVSAILIVTVVMYVCVQWPFNQLTLRCQSYLYCHRAAKSVRV